MLHNNKSHIPNYIHTGACYRSCGTRRVVKSESKLTGKSAIVRCKPARSSACQIGASPSMLSKGSKFALTVPENITGSCRPVALCQSRVAQSPKFQDVIVQNIWGKCICSHNIYCMKASLTLSWGVKYFISCCKVRLCERRFNQYCFAKTSLLFVKIVPVAPELSGFADLITPCQ